MLENLFSELETDFLRMKYLEENDLFFKPKTVIVGYTKEKKLVNGVENLLMIPIEELFLSIKKNLKAFFELPAWSIRNSPTVFGKIYENKFTFFIFKRFYMEIYSVRVF